MQYCPQCSARFEDDTAVCPHDGAGLERFDRLIGTVVDGKYRVESLLGAGAMGAVYRATQLALGRTVALKVIRDDLLVSRGAIERFKREAEAVARLKHPNIVTVFDAGVSPAVGAYTVMEHLEGRSLKAELQMAGPLPPGRAVALMRQICSALHAAHSLGIVHRDLKPQNIFLERTAEGAVPKVLDFGIAKVEAPSDSTGGASLTGSGVLLGTPLYMSPEQCENQPVDARSDVYALGCVLFEMLAGRAPFVGSSVPTVLVKHLGERPRPPSAFARAVPPALDDAVLTALEKAPRDRFQTAAAFGQALAALGLEAEQDAPTWSDALDEGAGATRAERLPRELRVTPHNLPNRALRSDALAELAAGVRGLFATSRALTVTGPAGVERTGLAGRVATDALEEFPDGVWLVEVGPLSNGAQLERAVAAVVGVSATSHGEPLPAIAQFLRGKRVLLVLDGCDHLTAECASFAAELLATCPGLRVMATSDGPLGVGGERTFALDPVSTTAPTLKAVRPAPVARPYSARARAGVAALVLALVATTTLAVWLLVPGSGKQIDAVAVLPFTNTAADPEVEYLADGLAESIINELAELPGVRVMARTTVFRYKGKEVDPREVGRELDVGAILVGRVARRGDAAAIQVELVDTSTGLQLWGRQYSRPMADVLSVEEDIAREISGRLSARLGGDAERRLERRETESGEAYQAYLRGRYHLAQQTEADWRKAVAAFEEALRLDPRYARAHAGLADAYVFASNLYLPPDDAMGRAREAANRALAVDAELAEAHASLAAIRFYYEWDRAGAEAAYRRAIDLNPGYAAGHASYGFALVALGRFEEGIAEMRKAERLDPLSMPLNRDLGSAYFFARDYDRAIAQYRRAIELDPGFRSLHVSLGMAYVMQGRTAEALAEFAAAGDAAGSVRRLTLEGYARAAAGDRGAAERALAALAEAEARGERMPEVAVARIHAALGDRDRAFERLERAVAARSDTLVWMRVDPRFDALRADPRFDALLARIGR